MISWAVAGALYVASTVPVSDENAVAQQPEPVAVPSESSEAPLRIALIGLVHGHSEGLLWQASRRGDIELVGIFEPDAMLFRRLARKHGVDASLRFDDVGRMLDETRPEAASVMTSIADHADAVEACAKRGVHVLVEKPLAFRTADAERIAALAEEHSIHVLTNYETSWYASVREAHRLVTSDAWSPVRRMVFRHGHRGPREIGCSDEFLAWLTDPAENGGGALTDFGCYGAALATWLMDGARPISVTAVTSSLKPEAYPHVDDDATIVLGYPRATAVIQASWAWTHDNKEMDLHTERGSLHAAKWDRLTVRSPDGERREITPPKLPARLRDEWTYLRHVVRGECAVDPLSSLELNLVVVEILTKLGDDPDVLANTLVLVRATAGMRLLALAEQSEILAEIDRLLATMDFGTTSARVISGDEEGLFGWLTANYVLGHLEHGGRFPTVGALDLGGASTQITFQPLDYPQHQSHTIALGSNTYRLYSKSYLGLGQDEARERVANPACFLIGYPTTWGPGTGDFDACRDAIRVAFKEPCSEDQEPCSAFGAYQPPLYGDFLALSAYAYVSDFFELSERLRPQDLEQAGRTFCARDWQQWIAEDPAVADNPFLPTYCYSAAHIVTLLTEGFGFPPETDRITAPIRVQGATVGWTLGALLYELAGRPKAL